MKTFKNKILNYLFPTKTKKLIGSIWYFGCNEWRIESKPTSEGKSNLKLYAENKLIFEGSYGDLIRKINREETSTKNEQNN